MDYFVQNGRTDYAVLLPETYGKHIAIAAAELARFFKEASGASLGAGGKRAISLGNTPLFREHAAAFDMEKINSRGYFIRTFEKNVVICARTELGVLYGVYELLEKLFGIEFYAADEIDVPRVPSVPFTPIDIANQPAIEYRQLSFKSLCREQIFAHRQRAEVNMTDPDGAYFTFWGTMWVHTMTSKLLPPEENADGTLVHPDWYSSTRRQLCMTNEEARLALVEKLKAHLLKYPDVQIVCVGIEDNNEYCTCEKCRAAHEKYGIGGVNIRFVNAVARDIEAWRQKALPDKHFKIGLVAYVRTKNPPVKTDEKTGKYVPLDPSFMLEKNIVVLNCTIDACGLHPLDAPCNHDIAARFEKWKALGAERIAVWDYHSYFDNNFIHLPGVRNYAENLKKYVAYNAFHLFCEGQGTFRGPDFHDLKAYLLSKLSWNPQLETERLIDGFFTHYYRSAAPFMRRYFDRLEEHYRDLEKEYAALGKRGYHISYDRLGQPDLITERHWPKALLSELDGLLRAALRAAEKEGEETREKLLIRVKLEKVMVDYLYIELYTLYCSESEMQGKIDLFRKLLEEVGLNITNHWADPCKGNLETLFGRWSCRYPARTVGG